MKMRSLLLSVVALTLVMAGTISAVSAAEPAWVSLPKYNDWEVANMYGGLQTATDVSEKDGTVTLRVKVTEKDLGGRGRGAASQLLQLEGRNADWSSYDALRLDVDNTSGHIVRMAVWVIDRDTKFFQGQERTVKSGVNTLVFDFEAKHWHGTQTNWAWSNWPQSVREQVQYLYIILFFDEETQGEYEVSNIQLRLAK